MSYINVLNEMKETNPLLCSQLCIYRHASFVPAVLSEVQLENDQASLHQCHHKKQGWKNDIFKKI